jgi:hypothetical protein
MAAAAQPPAVIIGAINRPSRRSAGSRRPRR